MAEIDANRSGQEIADSRLEGLDALRGLAAICVLGWHMKDFAGINLAPRGYLAVDFFFLLSGYIMSRTYESRMKSGKFGGRFIWARIKRLWPLLCAGVAISAYISLLSDRPWLVLGTAILCIPTFWEKQVFPLNGPQWSIFFEIFANLVHAVGLFALSTRMIAILAGVMSLATLVVAGTVGSLDVGGQSANFVAGFPRVLASYLIGIFLWRSIGDTAPMAVPAVVIVAILPFTTIVAPLIFSVGWFYDWLFVVIASPALLCAGLCWDAGRTGVLLGSASYPFYILHAPVIFFSINFGFGWQAGIIATTLLAISFGLAQKWKSLRPIPDPSQLR